MIDLNIWRKENWTELFYLYIKNLFDEGIDLGGYEEEVITHTLKNKFYILPPKFNLMTLEQVLSYKDLWEFRQPLKYYSEKEIDEAKRYPIITHTTNFFYVKARIFEEKSDHPQRNNYVKYRSMTEWKDDPAMNAHYSLKHYLIKNLWHWIPKPVSLKVARFIRNEIRPRLKKKRDDI